MANWLKELMDAVLGNYEHYEKVYPFSDGEGTAGAPIVLSSDANDKTDAAATTQDYYGEPKRIVPVSVGGDFTVEGWRLIGLVIDCITPNKYFRWELLRLVKATESAKNGGNNWVEGETALTLASGKGANFEDGDVVWIRSDEQPEGEIVLVDGAPAGDVVTIARETVNMANPNGLRWDHTTSPKMYLARRAGGEYRRIHGIFSAPSAKEMRIERFHGPRAMKANDGVLARIINMTDSADDQQLATAIIYDRGKEYT